ncbi:hypothetical protein [Natronococcus amylolyticus]|uniref:hypothetical protein n=1 Tax=Natronococcus amylolyticus TaxID=44470 RepID=UPI001360B5E9|nr:hypothetical protein [Natronococcus amylolyticus]
MQTGNAVDERILDRERQLLAVLVLGPLLLVQVVRGRGASAAPASDPRERAAF